ncbi:hypothetical protein [Amycolatopsis orientalis]|uniref:hypothetical protein n=1 Tax=Amycolatopsis orientalis TaxID=31958 RepID=UPI000AB1D770|nr:hypothetical protein [Amycolatopsis orientalis]
MTDTAASDGDASHSALNRIIAGHPHAIGSFRFHFADQSWEWSDDVARLHGYAPGTVQPTTELLLSHKHPEDRDTVAGTLAASTWVCRVVC